MELILNRMSIVMLLVSIMIQICWELKSGTRPPLWVTLPRLVAATAPLLLIFLK